MPSVLTMITDKDRLDFSQNYSIARNYVGDRLSLISRPRTLKQSTKDFPREWIFLPQQWYTHLIPRLLLV